MADQNFRVKRGLEVGIGGTVISALSTGNVGIASTNPTSKLTVTGDILVSGVVTATSFRGDGSQLTGIGGGGGGGESLWVKTSVGIHTLSKVGMGPQIHYKIYTL